MIPTAGSTEGGAVDPIREVVGLREEPEEDVPLYATSTRPTEGTRTTALGDDGEPVADPGVPRSG